MDNNNTLKYLSETSTDNININKDELSLVSETSTPSENNIKNMNDLNKDDINEDDSSSFSSMSSDDLFDDTLSSDEENADPIIIPNYGTNILNNMNFAFQPTQQQQYYQVPDIVSRPDIVYNPPTLQQRINTFNNFGVNTIIRSAVVVELFSITPRIMFNNFGNDILFGGMMGGSNDEDKDEENTSNIKFVKYIKLMEEKEKANPVLDDNIKINIVSDMSDGSKKMEEYKSYDNVLISPNKASVQLKRKIIEQNNQEYIHKLEKKTQKEIQEDSIIANIDDIYNIYLYIYDYMFKMQNGMITYIYSDLVVSIYFYILLSKVFFIQGGLFDLHLDTDELININIKTINNEERIKLCNTLHLRLQIMIYKLEQYRSVLDDIIINKNHKDNMHVSNIVNYKDGEYVLYSEETAEDLSIKDDLINSASYLVERMITILRNSIDDIQGILDDILNICETGNNDEETINNTLESMKEVLEILKNTLSMNYTDISMIIDKYKPRIQTPVKRPILKKLNIELSKQQLSSVNTDSSRIKSQTQTIRDPNDETFMMPTPRAPTSRLLNMSGGGYTDGEKFHNNELIKFIKSTTFVSVGDIITVMHELISCIRPFENTFAYGSKVEVGIFNKAEARDFFKNKISELDKSCEGLMKFIIDVYIMIVRKIIEFDGHTSQIGGSKDTKEEENEEEKEENDEKEENEEIITDPYIIFINDLKGKIMVQ